MYDEQKPYRSNFQADIGISVRKVSNGYSVKINSSIFPQEVGSIIVADSKERCFEILGRLFDACDQAKEKGISDCGDPDTEPA